MDYNHLSRFEIIQNGIFDDYKKERYVLRKLKINVDNIEEYPTFYNYENLRVNFDECSKMYNSISRRKTRIFKKLLYWFYYVSKNDDKKIIFGTLTFRDDILNKTSKDTRRQHVRRFLSDKTIHYVANIDYGKKNNREHYHFIALISSKIDKTAWKDGMSSYKSIRSNTSLRNRKNYLLKLTNHTYKDSTKQEKVISDRNDDKSLVAFICKNIRDFENFKTDFYKELFNNK